MKRLVLISLLACVSVCFAFTNASAPATYSRTVAGTVYDSQDLTRISGIVVSEIISGKVVQTTETTSTGISHCKQVALEPRLLLVIPPGITKVVP